MALQTSIAQYFNSRKRRAIDEINKVSNTNKVLILDKNDSDVSDVNEATTFDEEGSAPVKKIIYDSPKIVKPSRIVTTLPKLQRKTPKTTSHKKLQQKSNFKQSDIRKSLLTCFNTQLDQSTSKAPQQFEELPEVDKPVNVPFEIKGSISPKKALNSLESPPTPDIHVTPKKNTLSSLSTLSAGKTSAKQDSIEELKSKLIRRNRLDEIKNALKKLNEGHEKLKEIEAKIPPKSPSLKKFKAVEIEVSSPSKAIRSVDSIGTKPQDSPSLLKRSLIMSPGKTETNRFQCFMSPGKSDSLRNEYISPRKLFTESSPSKAAAFERHSALVAKGKPSLVLPHKYRMLAETFRAVDTVVSILFNRSESVFFSKLKASVQQMSKKNLTETHLAQIHAACPDLFTFRQEKLRHVPGLSDKYELAITPVFDCNQNGNEESNKKSENSSHMTPSILLERKRKLYFKLLEITKDYHEKFLLSLDPPMVIEKSKLTRWHPEFDVDGVPHISAAPLPKPPNVEMFSSAKDVLSKARSMFICNPRMEKALEKVSNEAQQANDLASASIPALTSALKGIPSSLLEKVRAKQAAKAAENLTRNPLAGKRRVEYSRLPELARIVRNIFVGEKKNILPKALVLAKLSDSFREVLTPGEMEHHLKLLTDCSSGWLTILDCRKETFFKISKETDLSRVLLCIENAVNKL